MTKYESPFNLYGLIIVVLTLSFCFSIFKQKWGFYHVHTGVNRTDDKRLNKEEIHSKMCPFLLFFTPFLSVQESNRHLSHKTMRLTANPKTSIRRKDYSIQKLEKDRNLAESLHKQELLSPFGFLYLTKISYSIWIQIFLSARMQYDFKLKFKSIKRHWPEPW